MEKLYIKNFGGIKEAEIPLSNINVFIGPQASGKSIIVKLIFYFKKFWNDIINEQRITSQQLINNRLEEFRRYFPEHTWPAKKFEIVFSQNSLSLTITKKNKNIKLELSDEVKNIINIINNFHEVFNSEKLLNNFFDKRKEIRKLTDFINNEIGQKFFYSTQIFIPAGRSCFSNIIKKNIFSFTEQQLSLDPFLIHFGKMLEIFNSLFLEKRFDEKIAPFIKEILKGEYFEEEDEQYILHNDGRKVQIAYASSGQQEIYPLLMILTYLFDSLLFDKSVSLYVEEPEAHLYPRAQKNIVKLLVKLFNRYKKDKIQINITTHSPYILSSFNNFLYGGYLEKKYIKNKKKREELYSIYPKDELLTPGLMSAYSLNGKVQNIMNEENHLIDQNALDEISNEIADEFDKLLDLEYGKK